MKHEHAQVVARMANHPLQVEHRPQTILDQRGLAGAAAVGGLPEDQQHAIVAEIMRREVGVMSLSALVVVFLALRAASTAHGF